MAARPRGGLRLAALGAGALGLGAALAAATPPKGEAQGPTATMAVSDKDERVRYGEHVAVRGRVASGASGRSVLLQFARRGGNYRTVHETVSERGGAYRLGVRPRQSGTMRVVVDGGTSEPARVEVAAHLRGRTEQHERRGDIVLVGGRVKSTREERKVYMRVSRVGVRDGWHTVDRARTDEDGRFRSAWRPERAGRYRVRVEFRGDGLNGYGRRTLDEHLRVYRPAAASWYGPGFYGNRTGCGRTLQRGTLGVAHKSLPCGERLTLRYRGRSVRVPVIDRGPYSGHREFDLTAATKRRLGFGSTGRVWTTAR